MAFSFIHISDIHLGRSFSDLSKYSNDEKTNLLYKNAVKKAFNNIIDFALLNNIDFILIAGDTFDSNEQDFNSKLILKDALKKLNDVNIKVFIICGNHDPINTYNKNTFTYDENSNIKIIGVNTPSPGKFPVYNKANEQVGIIHAFSFTQDKFNENPIKYFTAPNNDEKKFFNIGLLHCDLNADKNSPYAPCLSADLKALNYNYWALGHIHVPDFNNNSIIRYSGTIQGRNTKETGAHGFRYIKVDNCNIVENTFIAADVIRFENLNINLSLISDLTDAYDLITDEINTLINKEKNVCELFLLKITLYGCIKFYDEINDEFYNTISEKIKTCFFQKIYISQIINETETMTDNEILAADEGISGEIYKTIQNETLIENSFLEIENQLKNVISQCNFNNEEYENFKTKIIKNTKEKCINLCSKVYNAEIKEEQHYE